MAGVYVCFCNNAYLRTALSHMVTIKKNIQHHSRPTGKHFKESVWEESQTHIKTVVDVVREPVLILDNNFRVMVANEPFYRTFEVMPEETEKRTIYELGNGQWNIPELKKLLDDVIPKNSFFKGFEVTHDFPFIGRRIMILNARQIYYHENSAKKIFPPIILLAIEDVTEMMGVAEMLASRTNDFESRMASRTEKLEECIKKLEKEINGLKNNQKK